MDDMTTPELLAEYYDEEKLELEEDDTKVDIEDYQYTRNPY
jgi:hypothetical protein